MTTRSTGRCARALACLGLVLLFLTPAARAQAEPRITAQLTSGLVKLGESVSLRIQVDDAREAAIVGELHVDGLAHVGTSAPLVNERMAFNGGRRSYSRTISWALELRPERLGEFTIPPILLSVDGKDATTPELTLTVVEDMQGKELGMIEFVNPPTRVYEGEPFTIELLCGWDMKLGAEVNYLNVILPWWGQLPGALEIDLGESNLGLQRGTINLNRSDQVVVIDLGERVVRGRPFRVIRLKRTFIATRPGELEFPRSSFEFGEVKESFFERRKKTYYVQYDGFRVEVLPLPEDGRPFDFSGAVGELGAVATPDRRDVEAGESIKFTVEWSGRANLEFFEPPDLKRVEGFEDFKVYGSTDRATGGRRTVVYDLAPTSTDIQELPAVPLSVFDPRLGAYTRVTTRPIPIRVRALAGESGLEAVASGDGTALDVRDIQTAGPGERERTPAPGAGVVGGAMLALPLVWLGLRARVRRRGDPAAPAARRRRHARRVFARELRAARSASEQEAALFRFLGARSGEPPEAWEGCDPVADWRALGFEERAPAEELASALRELEARHWSGDDGAVDSARLVAAADAVLRGGL